jgi:hypothetical protein
MRVGLTGRDADRCAVAGQAVVGGPGQRAGSTDHRDQDYFRKAPDR